MNPLRIAVVVPTFQDPQAALQTAQAVLPQLALRDQLWIVDNGSQAQHLQACTQFAAQQRPAAVQVLVCATPGSYAARNWGAARADGDVLVFTDAGCVPQPGWLDAVRRHFASGGASRLTGPIEMTYARARPSLVELVDARMHLNQDGYAAQGWAATANLAVRRDLFERLGGFDARLRSGGDYEFGIRAMALGHDIGWSAQMQVQHAARATVRELLTKRRRVRAGHVQVRALDGFAQRLEQALQAASRRTLATMPRRYPSVGPLRWQLGRIAVRLLRSYEARRP